MTSSFDGAKGRLATSDGDVAIARLDHLAEQGIAVSPGLPHTLRILLENLLRHEDGENVGGDEIGRASCRERVYGTV